MNENNKITVGILTPLSVGVGNEGVWKPGVDYVYKDGKVFHLSVNRMVEAGFDAERIAALLASANEESLLRLLGDNLEQVSDLSMQCPVQSPGDIRMMIREGLSGKPYIPGSSLKGAIRSALYGEWKEDADNEREVFGQMNDGSDFMRFIQVGDVVFDSTFLVNTKIYNLTGAPYSEDWTGGWKHQKTLTSQDFSSSGFNTLYECLLPGTSSESSIKIDETAFSHYSRPQPKMDKKEQLLDRSEGYTPIENLFDTINSHTYSFLERERAFFTKYPQGEHSQRIIGNINALMNKVNDCIESGDSCILKMSAGAGFHSITGDWQYPDHTQTGFHKSNIRNGVERNPHAGKKYIKSRKIACYNGGFALMGFVKLTVKN